MRSYPNELISILEESQKCIAQIFFSQLWLHQQLCDNFHTRFPNTPSIFLRFLQVEPFDYFIIHELGSHTLGETTQLKDYFFLDSHAWARVYADELVFENGLSFAGGKVTSEPDK